jgi:hypothetical protein
MPEQQTPQEEWLRPRAFAKRVGLSVTTVRRMIRNKKVTFRQVGPGAAILIDVQAFLRACTYNSQQSTQEAQCPNNNGQPRR